MKRSLKILVYLLVAVPILFIGCKKSELADNPISINVEKNGIAYCGTPMVTNLYTFGGTTSYGTVTVGNDANNLYITYVLNGDWEITNEGEWWQNGVQLFVGTEAQLLATHVGTEVRPDGTGHFYGETFPYQYVPAGTGVKTYMFTIPRNTLTENCPLIVAMVHLKNSVSGEFVWDVTAKANTKCEAYYLKYCMQYCYCETAYAKAGSGSTCFLTLPGVNSNNWGWSNLVSGSGNWEWPIYASAAQCNPDKGTLVGNLHVFYDGTAVTVTYDLDPGFNLTETHLWLGADNNVGPIEYLPMKNGKYITAPGQFGNTHSAFDDTSTDTFGPVTIAAPFYIAAHAGVCW